MTSIYSESKKTGWFSRRNQTSEAYEQSTQAKMDRLADWVETIEQNKKARANRTSEQQLALLDNRLGTGAGAKKERKRLARLIANRIKNEN